MFSNFFSHFITMKFNSTEKLHDLCGSILSLNVGNTLLLCYCHSIVMKPEKAMAPHSSTLAWKVPWTEEPGRLQSMGSLGVGHDWATSLSLSCIGEGNGNPLQCSCLENPRDGGAWWPAVYGVAQSRTRLKRLSSSSSNEAFINTSQQCFSTFSIHQNHL